MAKNKKEVRVQVNVDFNNSPELYAELMKLAQTETEGNVSLFVRKMCREGIARRHQLELGLEIPSALPSSKGKGNLSQRKAASVAA